jgi:hypothetical protein
MQIFLCLLKSKKDPLTVDYWKMKILSIRLSIFMQLHNVTFHSRAELCTFGDQRVGGDSVWNKVREILPQSRQSDKLFSSRRNWDSPTPSPAGGRGIYYNILTVNKDDRSTTSLQIITLWAKLTATVGR